jgi:hypothetical protein
MSMYRIVFLLTILTSIRAGALPGKLQNSDFKTPAQITSAGGTIAQLLNDSKIYVTANGINQQLSTAITSGLIGGGGGVNLLSNGNFEASGITGWTTFQSTISSGVPTGAPGTCASCSLAISANTSAPLDGQASLQLLAASSVTQGQGFISQAFNVPAAYRGQVLSIKGYNSLVSGSPTFSGTSTSTFAVYVYDVTNAAWVQPAGAFGIVSSAGPFAPISFQVPSTTTSLRLAVVAVNSLASATTILFDDLSVGPNVIGTGPTNSLQSSDFDGRNVTFVGSNTTTQTPSTTVPVTLNTVIDRAGAWSTSAYTVQVAGDYQASGSAISQTAGPALYVAVNGTSANNNYFSTVSASGAISSGSVTLPNLKVGDVITLRGSSSMQITTVQFAIARVPGSSPIIQASASVSLIAYLAASQAVAANAVIKYDTKTRDQASAYSTSTGLFTAPLPGIYHVQFTGSSTAGFTAYIKANGVNSPLVASPTANVIVSGGTDVYLLSGQTVGVYVDTAGTFAAPNTFGPLNQVSITRTGN